MIRSLIRTGVCNTCKAAGASGNGLGAILGKPVVAGTVGAKPAAATADTNANSSSESHNYLTIIARV
jgi:hypothetical protein